MFKLFWVSKDESEIPELGLEVIDSKDEILDDEVGQVALDVLETEEYIYIVAPIAWVELEDIDLSINKTILTIKGTREKLWEYFEAWVKVRNGECFWGRFVRNVILPENLALNKIKAYMQNNLLVISIPKMKFDSKVIKINKMEW